MSNELNVNLTFNCTNGNYSDYWKISSLNLNQLTQGAAAGIASTTTAAANIDYGSISTANAGFLLLRNMDATNSVQFGQTISGTFYPTGTLLPSEPAMFRVTPSTQIQLKAVASTPNVQYWLLEA